MLRKRVMMASMCGLSLLGLVAWGSFNYLHSQEKPKPKEKQEIIETRGELGKTPATDKKEVKNDPKGNPVAKRSGPFSCDVHVDNRTNWIIHRVYIDGVYQGGIGPMGDLYEYDVVIGPTRLYAEADFTDGTRRYWGPVTVDCQSYATKVWQLVHTG